MDTTESALPTTLTTVQPSASPTLVTTSTLHPTHDDTWSTTLTPSSSPTLVTTNTPEPTHDDTLTMDPTLEPTPVPTRRVREPTHNVVTVEPTPRVWWHTTTTTVTTVTPAPECIPGWREWGPWSECSNQCGMGMKYRTR